MEGIREDVETSFSLFSSAVSSPREVDVFWVKFGRCLAHATALEIEYVNLMAKVSEQCKL